MERSGILEYGWSELVEWQTKRCFKIWRVRLALLALSLLALAGLGSDLWASNLIIDDPVDPRDGDIYWRWIGVTTNPADDCHKLPTQLAGSWSVEPLFPGSLMDPDLDKFCVFTFTEMAVAVPQQDLDCLDEMDGSSEYNFLTQSTCAATFLDLEPDLLAIVGANAEVARNVGPGGPCDLEDFSLQEQITAAAFTAQTGQLTLAPLTAPTEPFASSFGNPKPRLVLMDSSPEFVPSFSNLGIETSSHGETLRTMAQYLLCEDPFGTPDCMADITTRLVLPYVGSNRFVRYGHQRNDQYGGYKGTIGELAQILGVEVDEWGSMASPPPLIINLSIAWDPLYGGTESDPVMMHPAIRAVYEMLDVAVCEGAAVLAAAGNYRDAHPSHTHQPLMPAAWTSRLASCQETQPGLPVLWAVGAVDATLLPLSNAIPDGMPEIAAFGDHPVVLVLEHSYATPPLTGTSSATLVASASLAAATYYSNHSPQTETMEELVELLRNSGEPLTTSVNADFCAASWNQNSCPQTRSVSVCAAAHAGCGSNCPVSIPSCSSPPRFPPFFSGVQVPQPQQDAGSFTTYMCQNLGSGCLNECGNDEPRWAIQPTSDPANACPRRQYHASTRSPGTGPQPEVALCPSCWYDASTGQLHGALEFSVIEPLSGQMRSGGDSVSLPTLHLACDGNDQTIVQPDPQPSSGAFDISLRNLPSGCKSAALSYMYNDQDGVIRSVTVPIQVAVTEDLTSIFADGFESGDVTAWSSSSAP